MPPGGARTPEELETLLEDAFLMRDVAALAQLFDAGSVLVAGDGRRRLHGRDEIARTGADMWADGRSYLADRRRVLQVRDTALVHGAGAIHVMRRGDDRFWRYAISVLGVPGGITVSARRKHARGS